MWSCSSSGVDLRGSAGGSIHFAASAAADFCDLDRRLKKSVKVINKNNNFNKSERSSQRGESRLRWRCCSSTFTHADPFSATAAAAGDEQQRLVVVGGGAAGVYGALRAKSLCPHLEVLVLEKGQLLSKVRISGGGRCNVTTGLFQDPKPLAGQYPRGHKELRGSYFLTHGPADTAAWFTQRGVALKTESDGRMFPQSNSSASIIDCLLQEAKRINVVLQTKAPVLNVSRKGQTFEVSRGAVDSGGKNVVQAGSVLLATGSASQGYKIARDLGHSIIEPVPSLFSFKVMDKALTELAGVSFQRVKAELELPNQKQRHPELVQDGPLLITHWGFSGPVVLRLSAWAARHLFSSKYTCVLWVDFTPNIELEELKALLVKHKQDSQKSNMGSYSPEKLPLVKRFWIYLLERQGLDRDMKWARVSTKVLHELALLLKRCPFSVSGKGEFKDEFVTAGGVPLAEVNLKTMESRICPGLFFAGEILDVDGVTGGFNFQNAWTGGFIAGTTVAERSTDRVNVGEF
ncbi:hypothetical protein MPTK1_6g02760 [Marchantia polymorpha subsp. ruderalis]|uniref:FAD-dependent oxidoreductase 2 FAD binding domain-containing protein n=2 Tax=Marchantia polymorpha TaxID=3197 RepID=A0AAF6BMW1_MARPO|nr:hypothetical protein MARPO_0035s0063 [Marchantia polymorpha]BBN13345.1 hypothetical protein Mp_6g02760 [Marchantia polymorpha subsp. ruderalis]|eukprot:PTQ41273.1 hypothetical protein MARPO_0035s0063 [Marchantia polymorpha]